MCEKGPVSSDKKTEVGKGKGAKKENKKPEKAEKKEAEPAKEATEAAGLSMEKPKDPFAAMPKGNFDLDDFKRFYSNNDEKDSIPYFWKTFDKENYSIWRCDYKYNDELTMVFMSCNLIGG